MKKLFFLLSLLVASLACAQNPTPGDPSRLTKTVNGKLGLDITTNVPNDQDVPIFSTASGLIRWGPMSGGGGGSSVVKGTAPVTVVTANGTNTVSMAVATDSVNGYFSAADHTTLTGRAAKGANSDITSLLGLTTFLPISEGGTSTNSAAGARFTLGAAENGANSTITSLSGLTTPLTVAQGGGGAATYTTNGILVANGDGPFTVIAPGTTNFYLGANGTGQPFTLKALPSSGGTASTNGAPQTFSNTNTFTGPVTLGFDGVTGGATNCLLRLGTGPLGVQTGLDGINMSFATGWDGSFIYCGVNAVRKFYVSSAGVGSFASTLTASSFGIGSTVFNGTSFQGNTAGEYTIYNPSTSSGARIGIYGGGNTNSAIYLGGNSASQIPQVKLFAAGYAIQLGTNGTQFAQFYSATASLDFPSISSQASADLTITVTGAGTNDVVSLGLPTDHTSGLIANGFVSAVDTVTVREYNGTGSPIDQGAKTYRVQVTKY